jgi:hypothetical protein
VTRLALVLALLIGSLGPTGVGTMQAADTHDRPIMLDTVPPRYMVIRVSEDWAAYTTCDTRPKTWYGHEIPAERILMIVAHEADHRQTMAWFPSCEAFRKWASADIRNEIELEARAFCAGAKEDARTGRMTLDEAIALHSEYLALAPAYSRFGLSQAEAETEIRRYCDPLMEPGE